jgi:hypothetical protein
MLEDAGIELVELLYIVAERRTAEVKMVIHDWGHRLRLRRRDDERGKQRHRDDAPAAPLAQKTEMHEFVPTQGVEPYREKSRLQWLPAELLAL